MQCITLSPVCGRSMRGKFMISCIFAYAKGIETQSATVELADPFAALFIVRNDDHARAALRNWLAQNCSDALSDQTCRPVSLALTTTLPSRATESASSRRSPDAARRVRTARRSRSDAHCEFFHPPKSWTQCTPFDRSEPEFIGNSVRDTTLVQTTG